jgi:hypothetical protein
MSSSKVIVTFIIMYDLLILPINHTTFLTICKYSVSGVVRKKKDSGKLKGCDSEALLQAVRCLASWKECDHYRSTKTIKSWLVKKGYWGKTCAPLRSLPLCVRKKEMFGKLEGVR